MIKKIFLLFHTLRFLKPIQFYWRLYLKINRFFVFLDDIDKPVVVKKIELSPPIVKHNTYQDGQFYFLNEVGEGRLPVNWDNYQSSKLWLYNLHYFDYLNQVEMDQQFAFGLIDDWVKNNPVGIGNGWEPYTLSLRIVNWVKFFVEAGTGVDQNRPLYNSLFVQSRFLFKHLEYHLLGNHLFKNAVALIFAGVFFEGKEAKNWLDKGRQILLAQIREQVLADGGHFERSPMYHELILEDILDCLNLNKAVSCFPENEAQFISDKASCMLNFLSDILHPDGEIPFFNDSALQIAPSPLSIFKYASSLSVEYNQVDEVGDCSYIEKAEFGLFILQSPLSKMIFDVGVIGPDYLPGHAHCDTLSYELSIAGKRCIVNCGTFQYAGEERNDFRGTSAHSTVRIDSVEQHEIWSIFRVARRGYPIDLSVSKKSFAEIECMASHTGFERLIGQPIHKRVVNYQQNQIFIKDVITGEGEHLAESFIPLHPEVEIISHSDRVIKCKREDSLFEIQILDDLTIDINQGLYSARFGEKIEIDLIVLKKKAVCPFSFTYKVCF